MDASQTTMAGPLDWPRLVQCRTPKRWTTGWRMPQITELLHRWRQGSREAEGQLFTLVLPDLRRLARRLMNLERKDHSLQATELIGQIYLRLAGAKDLDLQNRAHFFAVAARAMRRQLIDHARRRPSADFVDFDGLSEFLPASGSKIDVAITVARLLDRMEATNPDWCRLVELRFYLGLREQEAAEILGMKLRSMQRMWLEVRQWLYEQMESGRNARANG